MHFKQRIYRSDHIIHRPENHSFHKMKLKSTLICAVAALGLWSCSTPKDVTYFQDLNEGTYTISNLTGTIKAVSGDKLSILVNSKDPALAALFNLPVQSSRIGMRSSSDESSSNGVSLYTVDSYGNINFPILGEVHVGGKTSQEIAAEIKQMLISRDLIKDPTVTVEFANVGINVLGEVDQPGRYNMERDRITILEGLAMAGYLTIQGERKNVSVLRENSDGTTSVYRIDLTSAESLYGSPAYYLQQNDVIYVEPNSYKKRQRQANGNTTLTASFWLSVASFLTTVAVLVFK